MPAAVPSDGAELSSAPVAAWLCGIALVEQRGDLVGVEFRLRPRRLLWRQRLRSSPWPASASRPVFLSFSAIGSGLAAGCGLALLRRRHDLLLFGELGRRLVDGLWRRRSSPPAAWLFRLGRFLDALGHLGEVLVADEIDRQQVRPGSLPAALRKTRSAPTAAPPRGARPKSLTRPCISITFEPCSNSVTNATRWKPAADSRPITFIIVP